MKSPTKMYALLFAVAAIVALDATAHAQTLEKFQFRLNWTLYGEHAPFFVARDKGFYKEEGLDVEILEGSGSTTVAQLVANMTNPVAYVDAATMMRGVGAGMPIKAVGVTLQQSPMSFIYRADAAASHQDRRDQGQPHRRSPQATPASRSSPPSWASSA